MIVVILICETMALQIIGRVTQAVKYWKHPKAKRWASYNSVL